MELQCNIKVVDMIMGSGKSSAAINYINDNPDKKFLYITPTISEVDRIIHKCGKNRFFKPNNGKFKTKLQSIRFLLNKGCNIASTHALFHIFDTEVTEICKKQGYTLIMDEVTDVVEPYNISPYDAKNILNNYVNVDSETGLLKWKIEQASYSGEFDKVKKLCDMNGLSCYGNSKIMWLLPIQIFNSFEDVIILTYMFSSQIQKYYYDLYNVKYTHLYIRGNSEGSYAFSKSPSRKCLKRNYKKLIKIIDNEKINSIGDDKYALCYSWYRKNCDTDIINTLRKNTINYFNNIMGTPSKNNLWTTYKEYRTRLSGKGYTKGFEFVSCRATNKHRNRTSVAYLINRYLNTTIKQFFLEKGVEIDEDGYALSEMLQFIWRSAIRDGMEITVYIPSSRMRNLLINWINENSEGEENEN